MKRFLLFLLAYTVALASYAQERTWQRVTVADSVTVEFPAQPKKYTLNGITAYSVYLDSVVYSATVVRNADIKSLADEDRQEFYDGVVKGAVERVNAKGVSDKKAFNINGFEGIRVDFQSQSEKLRGPTTMNVVLINGTVYNLFF